MTIKVWKKENQSEKNSQSWLVDWRTEFGQSIMPVLKREMKANSYISILVISKVIQKHSNMTLPPLCLSPMHVAAAAAAKSLQSCLTLCDPIDGSPPGSAIPGILQARTLEWVAISFSNAWKWKVKVKSLSRVRLLVTPWTAAHQAPLSMELSRQGYWSGVPLPSPVTYATRE